MNTRKLLSILTLSLAAGTLVMPATASARDYGDHQHRHDSSRPHASHHDSNAHRYGKRGHADHKHRSHNYAMHDHRKYRGQHHKEYRLLPRRFIYIVPGVRWGFSIGW